MTTHATNTRAYVVEITGQPDRLVRATYGHMAERHVIGSLVHARVATKDDLIRLLSGGVRLEEIDESAAGNGQDQQQPLQLNA